MTLPAPNGRTRRRAVSSESGQCRRPMRTTTVCSSAWRRRLQPTVRASPPEVQTATVPASPGVGSLAHCHVAPPTPHRRYTRLVWRWRRTCSDRWRSTGTRPGSDVDTGYAHSLGTRRRRRQYLYQTMTTTSLVP